MRLFVALQIPTEVREAIGSLTSELCQIRGLTGKDKPRWVRVENLHVTLKFIGEVAPQELDEIRVILSNVLASQSVTLNFHGLGFFPDENHPRVLWTGANASTNLQSLAAEIDQSLEKIEIPREIRAFTQHLTLARFEPPGISEQLRSAIRRNADRSFGSCATNEFHLFESKLKSSGAEYTTVQSFRFALAEA